MRIGKGQTVNVGRGKPERLKLGGSGENPQLIYLSESAQTILGNPPNGCDAME